MTNNELDNLYEALSGNKRLEVEIDGNVVELDLNVDDLSPILTMSEEEEPGEEEIQQIIDSFRKGLKRRYLPYYDKVRDQPFEDLDDQQEEEQQEATERIEAILRDNMPEFFKEVPKALGWVDEMDAFEEDFRETNSPQST